MTIYYSAKTGGFYHEVLHGCRTMQIPDPAWVRPTMHVPDPSWKQPQKEIPDPSWKRPTKEVPNANWVRPKKMVVDPAWVRPLVTVPDPGWVRPSILVQDQKNAPRLESGEIDYSQPVPMMVIDDDSAEHPMIEEPDMSIEPPMIQVDDAEAVRPIIRVEDEAAVPPMLTVYDHDAVPPMLSVPDASAVQPTIEVPNPECTLPPAADLVELTQEEYQALMAAQEQGCEIKPGANGRPFAQQKTLNAEEQEANLQQAVQNHLDEYAQGMGYDNIASAVSYADEPAVQKYQIEGQSLRAWRSLCWVACYDILAAVHAEQRPMPTAQQMIGELPLFQLQEGVV